MYSSCLTEILFPMASYSPFFFPPSIWAITKNNRGRVIEFRKVKDLEHHLSF